jgi:putative lipoic acid-binding regulatory protein
VLVKSGESIRSASEVIAACNVSMANAAVGLSDIVNVVADTGPTFKNMRVLTKKASEQLDGLASASEKLDVAANGIANAAIASDSLAVGMNKITAALSPLQINTETLTARLASVSVVSESLEQQLSILPQHATTLKVMGEEVADSLDQICEIIEDAVKHAQKLNANTSESSKAMEAATKLLTAADTMQNSVFSLHQKFNGLSDSVLAAQKALSDSSIDIKTSIARSTEALEADVNRSAKAASLLTERLVQVAQNIIDRTRHPETI